MLTYSIGRSLSCLLGARADSLTNVRRACSGARPVTHMPRSSRAKAKRGETRTGRNAPAILRLSQRITKDFRQSDWTAILMYSRQLQLNASRAKDVSHGGYKKSLFTCDLSEFYRK